MVFRIVISFIFIISLYPLSSATIINIPGDWPTIQQGIDASADGDIVLVQPGTYVENINFNGHNIVLGSLFLTTGDTSYISSTIITYSNGGNIITLDHNENNSTYISGFTIWPQFDTTFWSMGIRCDGTSPTISNNIFKHSRGDFGGGISCWNNAQPLIYSNLFHNNHAYSGGAIYSSISNPFIISNRIITNYSNFGGGIAAIYSKVLLFGNIVDGNSSGEGGGIGLRWDSSSVVENNVITNNVAFYGGGIGLNRGFFSTIKNNIIAGNYAGHRGGGIYIGRYCDPLILNNVIYNNYADSGGGIFSRSESLSTVINTILWADSAIEGQEIFLSQSGNILAQFCDIEGGWPGIGNIDLDPLFRDPYNGDFHLMSTACGDSADSPCIDAGDPAILDSLLDCSWGLGGPRSDMGAYGGGDSLITGIFDNMPPIPDRFMLLQNYPNPFNAQTTIKFVLPESQNVQLTIYDLLGRRVETLMDEYRQAGVHTVTFDAADLSSGVYFYRLEAGDRIETKRMVLLK